MRKNNLSELRIRTLSFSHLWLLGIVFSGIAFLYFILRDISLPYVGPNATNYNWYSLIAHNYMQFGFIQTKLLQILSPIQSLHDPMRLYLHHPPIISIFEAISFMTFGEHFWSGRLVVILFSIGSSALFFLIGRSLKNTLFGMLSFLISCMIPAASIFGQMIGQEALVLFFALLTAFALLSLKKTNMKVFLVGAFTSVILGTLSDWPMVYFTLALLPYFIVTKQIRLGISLFLTSVLTALCFLGYVFVFSHGLSDLRNAFSTRSLGVLLHQSLWPVRWVSILLIRFFLYFNPFIVIFSCWYLLEIIRLQKRSAEIFLVLGFFLFGVIHILLYPEGSFGHPYWTYYMLPFFIFSSSEVVFRLLRQKRFLLLGLIFLCSIGWLWKIEDWKTKQIDSNLWRYTLMQGVEKDLSPREPIMINVDSAIDSDLIEYAFLHRVTIVDSNTLQTLPHAIHHYVLSCVSACTDVQKTIAFQYGFVHQKNDGGEAYVLDLAKKSHNVLPIHKKPSGPMTNNPTDHGIKVLYRAIKDILNAPQL